MLHSPFYAEREKKRNNNLIFNSLYLRRESGERWARAHSFPGKVRRGLEAEPGPRGTQLGRSFSGPPGRPARPVSGSGRTGSYKPNRAKRDETVDAAEEKEARSPAPLFCLCCGGVRGAQSEVFPCDRERTAMLVRMAVGVMTSASKQWLSLFRLKLGGEARRENKDKCRLTCLLCIRCHVPVNTSPKTKAWMR